MNLNDYNWYILPKRRVAHAFAPGYNRGFCGMTAAYSPNTLAQATAHTRRCEACLMAIVMGEQSQIYKFFQGFVPSDFRRRRRVLWQAFLRDNPQYGPPSWRDRSIGAGK